MTMARAHCCRLRDAAEAGDVAIDAGHGAAREIAVAGPRTSAPGTWRPASAMLLTSWSESRGSSRPRARRRPGRRARCFPRRWSASPSDAVDRRLRPGRLTGADDGQIEDRRVIEGLGQLELVGQHGQRVGLRSTRCIPRTARPPAAWAGAERQVLQKAARFRVGLGIDETQRIAVARQEFVAGARTAPVPWSDQVGGTLVAWIRPTRRRM